MDTQQQSTCHSPTLSHCTIYYPENCFWYPRAPAPWRWKFWSEGKRQSQKLLQRPEGKFLCLQLTFSFQFFSFSCIFFRGGHWLRICRARLWLLTLPSVGYDTDRENTKAKSEVYGFCKLTNTNLVKRKLFSEFSNSKNTC